MKVQTIPYFVHIHQRCEVYSVTITFELLILICLTSICCLIKMLAVIAGLYVAIGLGVACTLIIVFVVVCVVVKRRRRINMSRRGGGCCGFVATKYILIVQMKLFDAFLFAFCLEKSDCWLALILHLLINQSQF